MKVPGIGKKKRGRAPTGKRPKAAMHRVFDTAGVVVLRGNPQLAQAIAINKQGYGDLFEAYTPAKQSEDKFRQAVLKRAIANIEANPELMDHAAIQQTCKLAGIEEPPAAAFAFPISKGSAVLQDEVTDSTLDV